MLVARLRHGVDRRRSERGNCVCPGSDAEGDGVRGEI